MADMTREEAINYICAGLAMYSEPKREKAIEVICKALDKLEAYENADLCERREIWNNLEEVAGCHNCKPKGDCEECEGGSYIDRVAYIPCFEPTEGSDNNE